MNSFSASVRSFERRDNQSLASSSNDPRRESEKQHPAAFQAPLGDSHRERLGKVNDHRADSGGCIFLKVVEHDQKPGFFV